MAGDTGCAGLGRKDVEVSFNLTVVIAVTTSMSIAPASLAFQEAHLHDDRSLGLKVTFVISLLISTLAVVLRIVSRRVSNAPLKADDYTIVVALVCRPYQYCHALLRIIHRYYGTVCRALISIMVRNPEFASLDFSTKS